MRFIQCLAVLGLSCVFTAGAYGQLSPELEAGYKAGFMCSGVFLAGRAPEDIARDELGRDDGTPMPLDGIRIDRENKAVFVDYEGSNVPRLALFVERLGTVLQPPGATLDDHLPLPPDVIPILKGDPAMVPWPHGDLLPEVAVPSEVDQARLRRVVDEAFSGEQYAPSKTTGVVVLYRGQLIAEQYAPTWGMHTQYRTWSTAKSITNALVGILVGEGKLDVKARAPITEWQDDERAAITIENLLHMSSALRSKGSMTFDAYWGGIDTAANAVASELAREPGSRWFYSNYDTLLLVKSIKEVLDDEVEYLKFPRRSLLNKIGMRHTFPETDPYGNYILSSQCYTTPRDLARFGLLYINDGVWEGDRILPEGWVEYSVTPAPQKRGEGRGYGAQFWLMNHDDRVPRDTYTTSGSRGQYCTIVPSRDVVVTRMGIDPNPGSKWDQERFVASVLGAIQGE